jgi:Type-IV b secretion system, inner-membrane complex component
MGDRSLGHEMTSVTPTTGKKPPPKVVRKATPVAQNKLTGLGFFSDNVVFDTVVDEDIERNRHAQLMKKITRQAYLIVGLLIAVIIFIPLTKPIYRYYARAPEQFINDAAPLAPLMLPNLTNHAILSWAATSVTEIMTIGFGDFEAKLLNQKTRFTKDGWDAFVKAFLDQKIDQSFRQHQLVLTTVPSDTPVITSQGENLQHVYEWHVQIPVIMTYATNNNVTKPERSLIELTISRVAYEQSVSGIAIDSWKQRKQ